MVVEETPVVAAAAAPVAATPGGAAGEAIRAQVEAQGKPSVLCSFDQ